MTDRKVIPMFPSEQEDAEIRQGFGDDPDRTRGASAVHSSARHRPLTPYQQWLENITRWDEELRQSGLRGTEPSPDGVKSLRGQRGEPE